MSTNEDGIVISVDAKRLIAITILTIITISTLYSYVVALFAWIAPSPGIYPFRVKSLDTYDAWSNPESSFPRGNTVTVNALVEKANYYWNTPVPGYTSIVGTTSYRVFITVIGPDDKPYGFYTATGSLAPGETKIHGTSVYIPSNAPTGVYNLQALVWIESLPGGRSLTPNISELTITVT
jgi:hypothetical protein